MGITTSTAYGRAEILWPDFAHEGGSALHAKIVASVGELSDNMTGKWSGEQTLPNGASYTFEHNFGLALGELTVAIYVAGAFVQEGSSAQWTLAQVDSENITITNNTGGAATFFAYCLGFNIKKVIGNASATNTGLMTSGNQTIGGNKKFLNGIATTNIYEDGLDTGVNIDGINVKDGIISNLQSQQLEQQSATPATPASGKSKFYVKDDGVAYILNSDGIETPVGSGSTIERVSHTAHGFIVGNVLYDAGTNFAKGNCTDAAKAEVIAMVSRIIDANTFEVITNGIPSAGLTVDCFKEGVLPSDSDVCFVSDVDGKLTYTEPNVVGQISKPCFFVRSVDATYAFGYFANMRGTTVGGTNVSTVIPLTLAGTTVIQNVSAWPDGGGGKINGTITVFGPATPQGCRVEINFHKRSGSSYEISAAFPASSIVAASGTLSASVNETNGNISITLPTITGATSASITFSIDSAALGATLPLAISASNVLGSTSGVAPAAGVIGEMFGTERAGTGGSTYSTSATTAPTSSATLMVSVTLNKGSYIISGYTRAVQTDGTSRDYVVEVRVGGTNVLQGQPRITCTNGAAGYVPFSLPILISTDSTAVAVYTQLISLTGTATGQHELYATRIG